ncbi:MAG: hypothetical protein M0D55_14530 [Elusimicrobiota bacterium]|nr:MAG: hypothetical protein M0D55_14530 [Elusimicrobiota bacterium]
MILKENDLDAADPVLDRVVDLPRRRRADAPAAAIAARAAADAAPTASSPASSAQTITPSTKPRETSAMSAPATRAWVRNDPAATVTSSLARSAR